MKHNKFFAQTIQYNYPIGKKRFYVMKNIAKYENKIIGIAKTKKVAIGIVKFANKHNRMPKFNKVEGSGVFQKIRRQK